ncbi:hypothetical protein, conserved [Plasmodium gonderi]|uniref:Uncharacterized protein n=1 Tax=Plasmodium gonderi TaxID=77519 RepID=A0A1Y1JIV2_PLAGO|nr:hypothetical protein, conserved [Plasmodium gonderi]GAW80722.1 hypothetical protein, conserved [Plasmodium gonderi]
MKRVMRIQLMRMVHSLVVKSTESKMKKIRAYINSYEEKTNEIKSENKYLGLLRNIYHTIPSRLNEKDVWNDFLKNLKQERCFSKLKKIVNKNFLTCHSFLCRQIVFFYYIGLDEEMNILLDKMKQELVKCDAKNFYDCDAHMNEDISDVIKMLYLLYNVRKTKKNYKDMVLLWDKYIFYSKKDPVNNLKYLFYFHLFYVHLKHSLCKIYKCIELKKHRMDLEHIMLLIRYVNMYLKHLYFHNVIHHREDTSNQNNQRHFLYEVTNYFDSSNTTVGINPDSHSKKLSYDEKNDSQRKIQNEIDIFLGNLFRINKNDKDYFIFNNFDDIKINGMSGIVSMNDSISSLNNVGRVGNSGLISSSSNNNSSSSIHKQKLSNPFESSVGIRVQEKKHLVLEKRQGDDESNFERNVDTVKGIHGMETKSEEEILTRCKGQRERSNEIKPIRAEVSLGNMNVGEVFEGICTVQEECGEGKIDMKFEKNGEIEVSHNELKLYRDIYRTCTNEVMKKVLLNKDKISPSILWNNFISCLFKDEFTFFLMNEIKNKIEILNEEQFFTYLRQVKLLQLQDHPCVINILHVFFKNYIEIEKKGINNFYIADKMTYYTDIFCQSSTVQKNILNMYRLNMNFFNIKILKKILAKLFYVLKNNNYLINGFDILIKNIMIKIGVKGSFSDVVMVLYTLRQYNFYKTCMNVQTKNENRGDGNICTNIVSLNRNYNLAQNELCNNIVYDQIQKKMLSFFFSLKSREKLYGEEITLTDRIKNLENLFHLSVDHLTFMKNDYNRIYEYMFYRTIIEKRKLGGKLYYDKYFDLNIILMINKHLVKLFFIFVNKFFTAVRSADNLLPIFDCVNNLFSDIKGSGDGGGGLNILADPSCGDTFSKKREVLQVELHKYAEKYPFEFTTVKGFGDLLLLTLLDNLIYFEIKSFHFINLFFKLFEENLWPLCSYHYIFFYRIFDNFTYSQINGRDKRSGIKEGKRGMYDGCQFSEKSFEKDKKKILKICIENIKSVIRENIIRLKKSKMNEESKKKINLTLNESNYDEENKFTVTNSRHYYINGKVENYLHSHYLVCEIHNLDCLINLIFCYFQKEHIIDIFKNSILPSINDYLKWNGKDAIIKYLSVVESTVEAVLNVDSNSESNSRYTNSINCNDFEKIRDLLIPNEEEDKIIEKEIRETIRKYEFFYINMMISKDGYGQSDDSWCNNFENYKCYIDFMCKKRGNYSALDILRMVKGGYKHYKYDKIECIIRNIKRELCKIKNYHLGFEFYVSYLFLLILFDKKIATEDAAHIFKQINEHLGNHEIVNPFWCLLLIQIMYIIKIQALFSFDLISFHCKNVTVLYNNWIIDMRREICKGEVKPSLHGSSNKSHDSSNKSHDSSNKSHGSSNKSHDSSNKSHDSSNKSHGNNDDTFKDNIIKYLQNKRIPFIRNVELLESPFIFSIYIPSMNLFVLDANSCLFCDIFVQFLQDNLFDYMNSKIIQFNENGYNSLVQSSS